MSFRGMLVGVALMGGLFATPLGASSLAWLANAANEFEYGQQIVLPPGFGVGEFTLELWVRLDDSYPVGVCSGAGRLTNWCDGDEQPYDGSSWWFDGNWLLDGHNNAGWSRGSFDLQFYGGGRVRWLFGDGVSTVNQGGTWAVQAWPASTTPSLLDGQWHQITLVRRWRGAQQADLELWVDGAMVALETSSARTDMVAEYWSDWSLFPAAEPGWFWGSEKQVAVENRSPLEDYKGLMDELRFWTRAKTQSELMLSFAAPVVGIEPGLAGVYRFDEGAGDSTCDSLASNRCIELIRTTNSNWSTVDAPLGSGSDLIFNDGFEG